MNEFDENEALIAMRKAIGDEKAEIYDDDELLNLVDIIWDFYEQNGLLEIDIDFDKEDGDDEATMVADIVEYATRMLRKDKHARLRQEHLEPLIKAEIAYEDSIIDD